MELVVPLEQVTVAVEGTDARFPVRRIYCVGRNYLDHIRETAEVREGGKFRGRVHYHGHSILVSDVDYLLDGHARGG